MGAQNKTKYIFGRMRMHNFFRLAVAVIVSGLAGVVGSFFTAPAVPGWYAGLVKPALSPPSWIFGPVWAILYALMGVSLYIVWKNSFEIKNRLPRYSGKLWNTLSERLWRGDLATINIVLVFSLQLLLNALWPYLFFGLRSPAAAFFEILALWAAILYTMVNFYRVSMVAAWLLAPYFLWVSFAAYLNYSIWILN